MKTMEWMRLLERQRLETGKAVFTITELANLSAMSRASLHVQLNRLVAAGVLHRYTHGLYGGVALSSDELLPHIDGCAYGTGHYALFRHNLVTQAPSLVTCFSNRRHARNRIVRAEAGTYEFVFPSSRIYRPPARGTLAPPEQALADFVFLCLRKRVQPESVVTLRHLDRLSKKTLGGLLKQYPATVSRAIAKIVG